MAKRSKPAPAPTLIEEAPAPSIAVHADEGGARGCMAPPQWNAAIGLQVAVRDGIDRPVDLVTALDFAADYFSSTIRNDPENRKAFQNFYDRIAKERELARLTEQKRISAQAGKKETGQ
jgi:hypothetical protein